MTGARALAYAWIDQHLPSIPCTVLDVGAGDAPLAAILTERGYLVTALDHSHDRLAGAVGPYRRVVCDLRTPPWPVGIYDVALAVWSLQHLLGDEAVAWRTLRDHVTPDGRLIVIQRHVLSCTRWMTRADPLNGYSVEGLVGLAQATGWRCEAVELRQYVDDQWVSRASVSDANAICAVLRPCTWG